MKKLLGLTFLTIAIVSLLLVGHAMMSPMPIAAATTALGGLIAIWILGLSTTRGITIGATVGALIGTALHVYSHLAEGRMHPDEGFVGHIVTDAAIGIAVGIVALAIPVAIARLARRVDSAPQHR
jgi:hypothetical protein